MKKWYVVLAKAKQERWAKGILEQVGIATYYPEVEDGVLRSGKYRVSTSALFPGYFFANFDYEKQFRLVAYCQGVRNIVTFGHTPAEIDPKLLEEIRERLTEQNNNKLPSFRRGEIVRVSQGALTGIKAIFDFSLPKKDRVVVLLRTLFHQSRAVMQLSNIERFSEAG